MYLGALLLVCATARDLNSDLVPVCIVQSTSGRSFVYDKHEWSRRDIEKHAVVEHKYYDRTSYFTKTNVRGVQNMFRVRSGLHELDKSDICYGWPENQLKFTRCANELELKRKIAYKRTNSATCKESFCSKSPGKLDDLSANQCMGDLPRSCLAHQTYTIHSTKVPPYKGHGYKVQSVSGLATLNYDIVPQESGTKVIVPVKSRLAMYVKQSSKRDCYLLLSAYFPVTGKSLPVEYIWFNQSKKTALYTLSHLLASSLYNMGEFDFQFINNHRRKPCEDDIIEGVVGTSQLKSIRGPQEPLSLPSQLCKDGDYRSFVIDLSAIGYSITNSLTLFWNNVFELPIKLQLDYGYSVEDLADWKVYQTVNRIGNYCSVEENTEEDVKIQWTPLRGTILPISVSPSKENRVTVNLMVQMAHGNKVPKFIEIRDFSTNGKLISATNVTLGELPSKRLQTDSEIIHDEEAKDFGLKIAHNVEIKETNFEFVPLVLSKSRGSSRDFRYWDTVYRNINPSGSCGECRTVTISKGQPAKESFWECRRRTRCNDGTGFLVKRKATFSKSKIPKLWGGKPHNTFGYAIDLGLPPCAQHYTQLNELKVTVAYTNQSRNDFRCQTSLMGAASLNVPEFTPSVYFEEIKLTDYTMIERHFHTGSEKGKSVMHYWFDGQVEKIGTLPRSIVIGYPTDNLCVDKIETIRVKYELQYQHPAATSTATTSTAATTARSAEKDGKRTEVQMTTKSTNPARSADAETIGKITADDDDEIDQPG